jgi:cytoskeletal protein RodZ
LSELENEQKVVEPNKEIKSKKFANLWMGIFFMVSSLSLIVLMSMFVFVWQPIWTDGFKDFHTISTAIDKLDKTAQPASATIPAMLEEMTDMHGSLVNLEEMTPEIKSMNTSVERMTVVIATHLGRMTFLMGQIENKLPPTNMMPW